VVSASETAQHYDPPVKRRAARVLSPAPGKEAGSDSEEEAGSESEEEAESESKKERRAAAEIMR
jgi:hypothetical protein